MIFICTHWSSMCPNLRHEIRMLPSSLLDIVNSACCCGCHRTLYITLWIFGSAIYRDWGKELWESPITCQPTKILAEPSFYCFIVAKLHQFQVTHMEKYASWTLYQLHQCTYVKKIYFSVVMTWDRERKLLFFVYVTLFSFSMVQMFMHFKGDFHTHLDLLENTGGLCSRNSFLLFEIEVGLTGFAHDITYQKFSLFTCI